MIDRRRAKSQLLRQGVIIGRLPIIYCGCSTQRSVPTPSEPYSKDGENDSASDHDQRRQFEACCFAHNFLLRGIRSSEELLQPSGARELLEENHRYIVLQRAAFEPHTINQRIHATGCTAANIGDPNVFQ